MDIPERIKRCIDRHPDWDDKRIAKTSGAIYADVEAVRRGEPVPNKGTPEAVSFVELTPPPPSVVTLAAIREKLDVAAMIRRELGKVGRGQLLPEDELCRLTAGRDRNRFRRAVENNPEEFRAHRIRLRLDESTDGKWYWGRKDDVAEALRIRDL